MSEMYKNGPRKKPIIEIRPGPDGCWEWGGCINDRGYGRIKVNGKIKPAHWFLWEKFIGVIPRGYELHHFFCHNRKCVNPDHLRLLTHAEHMVLHAERRRGKLSPEERNERRKKRVRESSRRQRDKMRTREMRRAKLKMPDGTYMDAWVPKVAGRLAVREHMLERWQIKQKVLEKRACGASGASLEHRS